MRARFKTIDHHPSEEHWQALQETLRTMARMAAGTCPAKTFVAALDCGLGKSTAALHFARALLASPDHRHVGMIICVGRLREAEDLAGALGDDAARVAVLTSNAAINALGKAPSVNEAQVLITTQQRVELATAGGGFAATASLHYRGGPRAVRVWDEAWLPGKVAAVREYALSGLLQPL